METQGRWDQLLIHDDPTIVYSMAVAMVAAQEDAIVSAGGADDKIMLALKQATKP